MASQYCLVMPLAYQFEDVIDRVLWVLGRVIHGDALVCMLRYRLAACARGMKVR